MLPDDSSMALDAQPRTVLLIDHKVLGQVAQNDRMSANRRAVAVAAAKAGASIADDRFRSDLAVDRKEGKTDVVTAADRDAQHAVCERIAESFPDEPVVGEENDAPKTVPADGPAWIVDPIDGTNNYVRNVPIWTTAVATVRDGSPIASVILAPALGDAFVAGPDGPPTRNDDPISVSDRSDPNVCAVSPTLWWPPDRREEYATATGEVVRRFADARRYGSTQYELALVASGALDGLFTNIAANPWDTVAGAQLVRDAGGTVTDAAGDSWHPDSRGLVASNGQIHDELLDAVATVDEYR